MQAVASIASEVSPPPFRDVPRSLQRDVEDEARERDPLAGDLRALRERRDRVLQFLLAEARAEPGRLGVTTASTST